MSERDPDRLLTRAEAAAMMRLSPGGLANLHARGEGPAYLKTARIRGKALYRPEVVMAYLESNGRKPTTSGKRKATSRKASHA
jgi:hypothetical protein